MIKPITFQFIHISVIQHAIYYYYCRDLFNKVVSQNIYIKQKALQTVFFLPLTFLLHLLSLQSCTWGVAYEVMDSQIEESLQKLNMREVVLGGYITETVEFIPKEKGQGALLALVYIATSDNPSFLGPASVKEIAAQIATCRGNTGHNIEYVVRLAEFMRLYCPEVEDEHLFSLEATVLNIFHDCGGIEPPDQKSILPGAT